MPSEFASFLNPQSAEDAIRRSRQENIRQVVSKFGNEFVYHGTTTEELASIRSRGLVGKSLPWDMTSRDTKAFHSFLTLNKSEAERYSAGSLFSQLNAEKPRGSPIVLRVKAGHVIPNLRPVDLERMLQPTIPAEISTPSRISPDIIEYREKGGKWKPLVRGRSARKNLPPGLLKMLKAILLRRP